MLKILLPVDGSDASNQAIKDFIQLLGCYKEMPEIHLLNVQLPLHGNVSLFIDSESIAQYHQDEGMERLRAARQFMDQAGVSHQFHIIVGEPADVIVAFAKEKLFDRIVIGPRGVSAIKGLLLGSVTNKVVQFSTIPVLLVK